MTTSMACRARLRRRAGGPVRVGRPASLAVKRRGLPIGRRRPRARLGGCTAPASASSWTSSQATSSGRFAWRTRPAALCSIARGRSRPGSAGAGGRAASRRGRGRRARRGRARAGPARCGGCRRGAARGRSGGARRRRRRRRRGRRRGRIRSWRGGRAGARRGGRRPRRGGRARRRAAGLAEEVGACEEGHVAEEVVAGFGGEREDASRRWRGPRRGDPAARGARSGSGGNGDRSTTRDRPVTERILRSGPAGRRIRRSDPGPGESLLMSRDWRLNSLRPLAEPPQPAPGSRRPHQTLQPGTRRFPMLPSTALRVEATPDASAKARAR